MAQKKVNTHGMKMINLRKASGMSKACSPYSTYYLQLSYNTDSGEILISEHISIGSNSWKTYHDENIKYIGLIQTKMTQQEIANMIYETIFHNSKKMRA